jgi:hypothetical protein
VFLLLLVVGVCAMWLLAEVLRYSGTRGAVGSRLCGRRHSVLR